MPIRNHPLVATATKKPSDEQGMLLNYACGGGERREREYTKCGFMNLSEQDFKCVLNRWAQQKAEISPSNSLKW